MAGVTIQELGLRFVDACMRLYWGSCWYPLLFAVGLICTLVLGRKRKSGIFVGYTVFLLLTVYNPLVVKYLIAKVKFENEYYRFIWILPVIPAVAYYGVRLVTAFRKTWIKVLMAAAVLTGFVILGNPLDGVVTNFARVVFDGSLNSIVRQYDAGIATVISRNASIYRSGSTVAGNYDENSSFYKRQKALLDVIDYHIYEDKEGFQAALKKSKTDFVVTQIGLVDHDFLTECGCELIAQTESCYIYRFDYSNPRK